MIDISFVVVVVGGGVE